ncbi:MAG TPA: sigma-70 family RNA polymerase sigma factor [Chitinophagaceae bacterium]|nr:sigma-70 family RNA polymerase sigma factor [Chitinophagaceae bacterium]
MDEEQLVPHLFRTEFTRIVSVLCKLFGIEHIETAEDITSETFLAALETWSYKGIPENPVAWLYAVAKNKAKNQIVRKQLFIKKITPVLQQVPVSTEEVDIDLSEKNITDSQLQMLFAICHPSISIESQIGLALRILCGFGIEEIANAFLTSKETVSKRLYRAKEKLQQEKVNIEFPSSKEIGRRLETVLTTLYLMFNEGYYSESNDAILREDLCFDAMRLTHLLTIQEPTDLPPVNALLSLMCFHASRFEARKGENGEIILYNDQDERLWDKELIAKGIYYLSKSSRGNVITTYHLEANIAYWHTIKEDTAEKWENILQLYNRLLQMQYSPIAALNRTYALSKANGKEEAIREAEKLKLAGNHYYYTLLGELYRGIDADRSRMNFEKAFHLAKTHADKKIIRRKLDEAEN